MNKHNELVKANLSLIELNYIVAGQENFFGDLFDGAKGHLLSGLAAIGGGSLDLLVKLFRKANLALAKAIGSNKMVITAIYSGMNNSEKSGNEIDVMMTPSILSRITYDGDFDSIVKSIDVLHETLKIVDKHRLEIETYYQKELAIFKGYSSIKTAEDAVSIIKELDSLKYPIPAFQHKDNFMLMSSLLPGGKEFTFNTSTLSYSINNESVTGKNSDDTLSKSDIVNILKKVEDIDTIFKVIHKANENYTNYLGKFNSVVKDSFKRMDKLKGEISSSLIRDLNSRLAGNPHVFSFYTNFLPKTVNYVDGYVADISGYFSKRFN